MSKMVQLCAIDRDGQTHHLQATVGTLLMEVLRDAGLGVEAVCGGCCACATCHVYTGEALAGKRGELESALVAATDSYRVSQSRLSCQIELSPAMDNLTLQIAPED